MNNSVPDIKVMIITPSLECGGAERFVSLLSNEVSIPGLQLIVAIINNEHPFYTIINPDVRVIDLKAGRVSRSFFKIRNAIRKEKPAIVFTTANHLNLFIAMFRSFLPGNVILLARETSVVSINSKYAPWPALYGLLLKRMYRKIDHIICQSVYMQDDLVKHYNVDIDKTSVIYNGVDPFLKYYDGPIKQYSFITVARLSPEKGIDRILRAVATLNIPFHYYIIGCGPEKENLQLLAVSLGIKQQVSFCGELQFPFAGMEDSHLYLMGSLYEGFPNAVIEANAIGIPVVAIDVPGGIAEIINDGKNGFLAVGDNDIAEKILKASTYSFNREYISQSAHERYSISKMKTYIMQTFSELYSQRKK